MQLTKLETFTCAILQGMAANPNIHPCQNLNTEENIVLAIHTAQEAICMLSEAQNVVEKEMD